MFRNLFKYWTLASLIVALTCAAAWAGAPNSDQGAAPMDQVSGFKGISKVKPTASQVLKVRPESGIISRFGGASGWNPMNWGADCCLPMPAKRQFVAGPRVWFARVSGEARFGPTLTGLDTSVVNFDDHLNFSKSGNTIWSVQVHYQFQPRWGIRYSFTPFQTEATGQPITSFNFGGQTFTAGNMIRSKWERFEHRAGLVFDLKRTQNSVTSVFAEWMFVQDKLTIGGALASETAVTWDDDKNLAILGIEFNKCLKNYRGSTLALNCKGGIAFLDDHIGYDAEAALNYLIPIRQGRFGYVKGGYRYAQLKKDRDRQMFSTTMDGAFVEVGFLF